VGLKKAKFMLFTGNLISGKKAEEMGLVFQSVRLKELDDTVLQLTDRIKGVAPGPKKKKKEKKKKKGNESFKTK